MKTHSVDHFLRLLGAAFLVAGRSKTAEDDNYALLYTCLCRK
jgi:hypothetical protein